MPKRKKTNDKEQVKRQKVQSGNGESSDNVTITKQTKKRDKENISWNDSDLLQLINKIEEEIPRDDSLSYMSRLEKIDWSNIPFKSHSVKECQQVWSTLLKQVRKFRLLKEITVDIKDWVKNPKSSPTKDAVCRHPDKPKQPPNSYMLFANGRRHEVMDKYPNLLPNDVAKKLGEMFKSLPTHEKEKYEEEARTARQEYVGKLQNFYSEHPEMIPKKTSKRSKGVQLEEGRGPPEKPKTPFQLFTQIESEKEELTDIPRFAFNQRCREIWNEMEDKDKFFWINWAEEQYNKYMVDMKEYLKIHPDFEPEKIKSILTKKEKKIKSVCSGKPEKPPHSPYHLFTKMIMESDDIQKISGKDVINYIAEKWKACSKEEKNEYKIRMEQMWEEYDRKLEQYLMTLPPEERGKVEQEEGRRKNKTVIKDDTPEKGKKTGVKLKKPKLPPLTDYKYFLSVYKGKENAATVWENMTDEEKNVYTEEREAERQNYVSLYEQYLKSLSKEELQKIGDTFGDQSSDESESAVSEEESEGEEDSN